jgi:Ca2+-binding EF-hand superfamily protein
MAGAAWVDWKDGRSTAKAPTKKFPKRPMLCKLSANTWGKCEQLFRKMDIEGTQVITIGEAKKFFKGAFNEVSAVEMFKRLDVSHHGAVTAKEFMNFWVQVKASGYSDKDIEEEVESLMEGNAWVDWVDQRDTRCSQASEFPRRPFLCRLSARAWMKCQELFQKLDVDSSLRITHEKAVEFFRGAFRTVSADEMFHRVDADEDGVITAAEFMAFWTEVRGSYSEKEIIDEIDALLAGAAWVDWKKVSSKDTRHATRRKSQEASQLWRESHAAIGRTTHLRALEFPKRPFLCKLSSDSWDKCAALFEMMDPDCRMEITREKAESFFKCNFRRLSVEELFKQVDLDSNNVITAEEFMAFWVRVRSSGYKDDDIMQEISSIMGGGAWVDWEDGRRPSVTPRRQPSKP